MAAKRKAKTVRASPRKAQRKQLVAVTAGAACTCLRCTVERTPFVDRGGVNVPVVATRAFVCAICGNKRCPHSDDHRNACTRSNAPGQAGSRCVEMPVADEWHGAAEVVEAPLVFAPGAFAKPRSDERTWWRRFCDFFRGQP